MQRIRTAEFVTPKHPDKLCDVIADTILDAHLSQDPTARVAVEVMGGHNLLAITGEISSTVQPDYNQLVRAIVGDGMNLIINLSKQSPEIAAGVDTGGAGDQGIMVGYATSATSSFMPKEYELARSLANEIYNTYPFDGKTQVTLIDDEVDCVVASFQHSNSKNLEHIVRSSIKANRYLINPAGEWDQGGFDADSGLSGRKLIVDNYGPQVAIGGGSFSGKDYTKVDRSGAYMARKIAVDLLGKYGAGEVYVKLAYAIGVREPVMAMAIIDGVERDILEDYDLSPSAIRDALQLSNIKFADTCTWGHFGRGFNWDRGF